MTFHMQQYSEAQYYSTIHIGLLDSTCLT